MGFRRYSFRPYVSASERRARADRKLAEMRRQGRDPAPVHIQGRRIATTFWGKAWCDNLERYSDFASRLPRGRTYARKGAIIDLQIAPKQITAAVMGTDLYEVSLTIEPLPSARWKRVRRVCSGAVSSMIALLRGELSSEIMSAVTQQGDGLFPSPDEIALSCSCPDWATMCKHVAAVLYGVGARLDTEPKLLFVLRDVDASELVTDAVAQAGAQTEGAGQHKRLRAKDLSSIFGVDIEAPPKKRKRKKRKG